ncbi:aldehyde dehydrogenase family protein [Sedimentibacter sp.]|uniref:aldehyde dehydrogenase family protein n=1 Tax=Sedimentibacter sp. TaxID=1960295 RepID=UPI00289DF00B|nr:aldehyde dehydrogenase family protein [Sedimentibacter sp.]
MKMLIGGQKRESLDGKVINIFNPANGELIDTVPDSSSNDLDLLLEHSLKGKKIWGGTPLHERSKILLNFIDKVSLHIDELAELLCKETGKNIKEARLEVGLVPVIFRRFLEAANHMYGITLPDSQPGGEKDVIFTRREALGTILCIIPFNFPASTYAYKVAPALATGNSVIVKPPSDNPLTLIRLTELLIECGIPGDALQITTGSGSVVGKYLVASPHIDGVSLTGSTAVGIETAKQAAANLHHVFLELGGNDAMIVYGDGDIGLAVQEATMARTTNCGQICIATKRFIVQNSVKDEFIKQLVTKLKSLKIGDPMDSSCDMGCLINEAAAVKVKEQVDHTLNQGAKCVLGGNIINKAFFEPTVLDNVSADMDIARDMEVFGPVFPVIGFDTLEEAVEIHNASVYGLNGGIITKDTSKAMKTAYQLECGTVVLNGNGRYRHPDIAFGGYKMSGIGREGVSSTLEELTQVKTIVMKGILA